MHGAPPVKWDDDVARSAQVWANKGKMEHSDCYNLPNPEGPAGENLAQAYPSLEEANKAWYAEVSNCGPLPGCKKGATGTVGHFTAMIWKGMKSFGCGISGDKLYVCRYKGDDQKGKNTPNFGRDDTYTAMVPAKVKTFEECAKEN